MKDLPLCLWSECPSLHIQTACVQYIPTASPAPPGHGAWQVRGHLLPGVGGNVQVGRRALHVVGGLDDQLMAVGQCLVQRILQNGLRIFF